MHNSAIQIRALALACFLVFTTLSSGDCQDNFKRYPLLELFTNTRCSICGAQDPGFVDRLSGYTGDYHMVSFYPGRPYSSCVFYQDNTSENSARWNFYPGLFGTPDVVINGVDFRSPNGVSTDILDDITAETTWLNLRVEETSGVNRTVTITLSEDGSNELEEGILFAVAVERQIMYDAPNGIDIHHNVFRQFLGPAEGEVVGINSSAEITYEYSVDEEWQSDEVYVVAWLMDPTTEEVINSGTRFDEVVASTNPNITVTNLELFPNPASSIVQMDIPNGMTGELRVIDASGRLVHRESVLSRNKIQLAVDTWIEGTYVAEIVSEGVLARSRFQVIR